MAKRQSTANNRDIRYFLKPQEKNMAHGDEPHKVLVKMEDEPTSAEVHSHKFFLTLKGKGNNKYTIQCDRPQTVLQAIRSKININCDENIIILWTGEGTEAVGRAIATHFPCKLLQDGEVVNLKETEQLVEDAKRDFRVDHNESFCVVNIKPEGGTGSKSKQLFRSFLLKKFSEICVYGPENMSLKEAIERDGRFMDFGDFILQDCSQGKTYVFCDDAIQQYNNKTLWICAKTNQETSKEAVLSKTGSTASNVAAASVDPEVVGSTSTQTGTGIVSTMAPKWKPVSELIKTKQGTETEEIYKILRAQFPKLKEILLNRFPGNSFQETFRKVNFGKVQQTFSDVGRMKKLLEMGNSVCKITVGEICQGTGFVLFQNYILTCAHLFKDALQNNKVRLDIKVTAMFRYETYAQKFQQNTHNFTVSKTFIDYDAELDYAILELEVVKAKVPPGLMKHCTAIPDSGEACLIGHPNGGVKKYDATCVIEKKDRAKEVDKHLEQIPHVSAKQQLTDQRIENILYPSNNETRITYNTFMYHGSSGSPVFDGECKVFGMHTGGFVFKPAEDINSVIEYSHPLILILKRFVTNLRKQNHSDLLAAVERELEKNVYQEQIILTDEELMDVS